MLGDEQTVTKTERKAARYVESLLVIVPDRVPVAVGRFDLAAKRPLHPGRAELRQEERRDQAEELAQDGAQDRLVENRADAVVGAVEGIQNGRAQHVVQVHLRRLENAD